MCGIYAVLHPNPRLFFDNANKIKHRGPDATRTQGNFIFHRLSINDTSDDGMQPFVKNDKMLICNGEIYNHKSIDGHVNSKSDCEKLIPLFETYGVFEGTKMIDGVFAFVYHDGENTWAGRDPIGVRPLFYAHIEHGIILSSEIKAFPSGVKPLIFPPGHIYDHSCERFIPWYPCYWEENPSLPIQTIKTSFIDAVNKRIDNTDRNVGFFLSGGLDSSLVAAVAAKKLGTLKTFSMGTSRDSPDMKAARVVSDFLKTDHTEVFFTPKEGFEAIPEVIEALETYDTTTIRASVPMYLLSKWVATNTNIRVILSGEGSDELFGGYLYFHGAPSKREFHNENMRLLQKLHQFDVLRADRCTAAHGLELRVPFLDKSFIDNVMSMPTELKLPNDGVEKYVLRDLFRYWLPEEILWRQKNAFSDAVGYDWVDYVREMTGLGACGSSEEFTHNIPQTNEELYYRGIFREKYGNNDHLLGEIWRPKWTTEKDPSARKLSVFVSN